MTTVNAISPLRALSRVHFAAAPVKVPSVAELLRGENGFSEELIGHIQKKLDAKQGFSPKMLAIFADKAVIIAVKTYRDSQDLHIVVASKGGVIEEIDKPLKSKPEAVPEGSPKVILQTHCGVLIFPTREDRTENPHFEFGPNRALKLFRGLSPEQNTDSWI